MSITATKPHEPAFDLVQLGKVRSGTQTAAIRTSEALEGQLAYLRQTRKDHGYSKLWIVKTGVFANQGNDLAVVFGG